MFSTVGLGQRLHRLPEEDAAPTVISVGDLVAPVAVKVVNLHQGTRIVVMSLDKVCCSQSVSFQC